MKQHLFFQYLELEKRYSPHTLKAYQTDLSQFFLFLQKTYELSDVRKVRHLHIRSWMVELLNKGVGTRSINRKLSCLKTYFKFLRKRKVIEANPMAKVIAPKVGKRLPQVIGEKQMSFLFENVEFGDSITVCLEPPETELLPLVYELGDCAKACAEANSS